MKQHLRSSLTRRAVLATPALAVAAGQAAPPVRLPGPLRLAIIGADGHTGEIFEPLSRLPDVRVVAVADANPEGLAALQRRREAQGARAFTDYRVMLDAVKPDVAAVCNSNGDRAAAVLAVVERRMAVIAEKPLAIEWEDLERVRRAVESGGVPLGMLMPMRYEPPYKALKAIVDSGEIGEVAMIDAQKSYKAGQRPDWFKNRGTYGSTMAWIGIHMVDLMRFTSGRELVEVACWQSRVGFPELGEMETVSAAVFRLDNGGAATLRMDYYRPETAATHGDDRLRLAGTGGVAEYTQANGVTVMSKRRQAMRIETLPEPGSVFVEFLEHAFGGKATSLPREEIFRLNEIVLHARDAADRRRWVEMVARG